MMLLALFGCDGLQPESMITYVQGGVIHADEGLGGIPIGPGEDGQERWFMQLDWQATGATPPQPLGGRLPAHPACEPLFHIDLGNVDKHIAQGGSAPDTAIDWSPNLDQIAIGTFLGEVIVVDGWSGAVQARKSFAETMVKQVEWSKDGSVLYVAEQSPDGTVWALDATDLEPKWSVDLSDYVASSPLPAANIYGVYTLPSAYGLDVLGDGSLFVVATHAWSDSGGVRQNQSQLLHISETGELIRTWPETSADAVMYRAEIQNGTAIIPVSKSSAGPADPRFPKGGALVFDLDAFVPSASIEPQPMHPWFTNIFLWEAVDIEDDLILLGLGDGRVQTWSRGGELISSLSAGSPILAGPIPIVTGIGEALFDDGRLIYQTSATHIPFGAAAPELRPPTFHPQENSIIITAGNGVQQWGWTGPHALQGMALGGDGATLVVGAGARSRDLRNDLYGLLLFDLGGDGKDRMPRLDRFCRTEGPVFFRSAPSDDGRYAVAEFPRQHGDKPAEGRYQLTVFR